ncbi:MAG TPA: DUF4870 domain-containing protein [Caulobacteraceae bacterium]|jgi:uncharacterized membrane protein|nr:DUF4870 domain-containing protein [Caulobacteraceae bacterium]
MSELPPSPPAPPSGVAHDQRQMAFVIYILYLAHFVPLVGWVASIVGLVLAYGERAAAPAWLASHFTFQIRTFWIGLVYYLVSIILCVIIIGFPLLVATWIWFVVRCALGLSRLSRDEAYPTPQSWTF